VDRPGHIGTVTAFRSGLARVTQTVDEQYDGRAAEVIREPIGTAVPRIARHLLG